jgi:hypothetical protein
LKLGNQLGERGEDQAAAAVLSYKVTDRQALLCSS